MYTAWTTDKDIDGTIVFSNEVDNFAFAANEPTSKTLRFFIHGIKNQFGNFQSIENTSIMSITYSVLFSFFFCFVSQSVFQAFISEVC